tara:strand:- start:1251 stop:1889 length:639 start_codon:yes stop_codon:yes gene_type:complete
MQLKKMIKNKFNSQIFFLCIVFFACLFFCYQSFASDIKDENNLIVLGKDTAPIKIQIFSSHTCPHCASFHTKIVPLLKKDYVDKGNVQLIFLDFPLDEAALNASKILHCLDSKKQIKFLDNIYEKQSSWASGPDIDTVNKNLELIAKSFDMKSEKFTLCLNNEKNEDFILKSRIESHKKYSINSTPTIVINEKKFEGSLNFKNLKKKIDKLI